mmetsp:Transcript_115939/g.247782  ORF Transcript_115939/g.247782 Transcript_115939/m.247782 type:complete len:200 (+) Transcript_115939:108-707(+)
MQRKKAVFSNVEHRPGILGHLRALEERYDLILLRERLRFVAKRVRDLCWGDSNLLAESRYLFIVKLRQPLRHHSLLVVGELLRVGCRLRGNAEHVLRSPNQEAEEVNTGSPDSSRQGGDSEELEHFLHGPANKECQERGHYRPATGIPTVEEGFQLAGLLFLRWRCHNLGVACHCCPSRRRCGLKATAARRAAAAQAGR